MMHNGSLKFSFGSVKKIIIYNLEGGKRMKKKTLSILSLLLVSVMLFASCGTSSKESGINKEKGLAQIIAAETPEKLPAVAKSDARKDTLIVGTTAPDGKFNPIYSSSVYDSWVVSLIMDGMTTNDPEGEPQPLVAKDWKISEDGKTYTFHLNKNVKFSDGKPVTADDVAFTYTAMCDPSYDGPRADAVEKLVGYKEYKDGSATSVEGIKVVDKNTITFTLTDVKAPAIYDFSYGIMEKEYYNFEKGNMQKIKDLFQKPIGCGPYKLKQYKPGQEVVFERNDNYWRGKPKIANVIMKVTNAQTVIQELTTGGVDIDGVAVKPENVDMLKKAGFLNLNIYPANNYGYIGWNMRLPMFADKNVRKALVYGFNRKGFVDAYYKGYADVCNSPISPVSWAYSEDIDKYDYDPQKAEELLDAAGWKKGSDGFRYKDGKKFTIHWLTYTGSKYVDALIPLLKNDWQKIGVEVIPELMEFAALSDKVYEQQDFELYNMAWSLSIDPDPSGIFGKTQLEKGGFNSVGWNNEESFKLMDEGLKETDQAKRKEIYQNWAKLANDELPYIFLNQGKEMYAVSSRVKNITFGPYKDWTMDIHKVELDNNVAAKK